MSPAFSLDLLKIYKSPAVNQISGFCRRTKHIAPNALDVRDIRESLNLSQYQFAALVHVSVKTLRNWEQGIRRPGGAAAALLTAIRNDLKNVIAALIVNQTHQSQA